MRSNKRGTGLFILFLVGGALLGESLTRILKFFFPSGKIQTLLTNTLDIGIHPPLTLDLIFLTSTVGFQIKLNFFLIVGILLGIYIYTHA